ncbi:MAG: hypothetical protein MMC33_001414 [Icmadophila ericetorum]|nr:hypothetical protein [Icmadophila ericetorum]
MYGRRLENIRIKTRKLAAELFLKDEITLIQLKFIKSRYSATAMRLKLLGMTKKNENYDPAGPGNGFEVLSEKEMKDWVMGDYEEPKAWVGKEPKYAKNPLPKGFKPSYTEAERHVAAEEAEEEEDESAWLACAIETLGID